MYKIHVHVEKKSIKLFLKCEKNIKNKFKKKACYLQ